jgi:hypothetical protein
LRVIHETQQRPLLGNFGQQAERGQGDQEAIGGIAGRDAERDTQGALLRLRKGVDPGQHRRAELMQPRERQLHLRLDACDLGDPEPRSLPSGVAQECRLSDTRLAADDEDSALAPAHVLQ